MSRAQPVVVYRIATESASYPAHDLTGEGPRRSGGRWNRVGCAVVYASTTRALAALETLVHLNSGTLPLNRYLVEITVPVDVWRTRVVFDPHEGVAWSAVPPGPTSLSWGDQWLEARRSAVAVVPSVVVPEEHNVLLNPAHPDARRVQACVVRQWTYDSRLG